MNAFRLVSSTTYPISFASLPGIETPSLLLIPVDTASGLDHGYPFQTLNGEAGGGNSRSVCTERLVYIRAIFSVHIRIRAIICCAFTPLLIRAMIIGAHSFPGGRQRLILRRHKLTPRRTAMRRCLNYYYNLGQAPFVPTGHSDSPNGTVMSRVEMRRASGASVIIVWREIAMHGLQRVRSRAGHRLPEYLKPLLRRYHNFNR